MNKGFGNVSSSQAQTHAAPTSFSWWRWARHWRGTECSSWNWRLFWRYSDLQCTRPALRSSSTSVMTTPAGTADITFTHFKYISAYNGEWCSIAVQRLISSRLLYLDFAKLHLFLDGVHLFCSLHSPSSIITALHQLSQCTSVYNKQSQHSFIYLL